MQLSKVWFKTNKYRAEPCEINYLDTNSSDIVDGHTYLLVGRPGDLTDGDFHLDLWLKHTGRKLA